MAFGNPEGDWAYKARSFHPNQEGHKATGRVLADLLRNNIQFADLEPGGSTSPSDGSGTPAEPAGPTIPDAFLDRWQAPEPMSRPGLPRPYYVQLQLWGEDVPGADGFEGLSSYSEDFGATPGIGDLVCSNDLDLAEASTEKLVFTEIEDVDLYDNCSDKGTVTVTLSGDQLVYDYVGDGGSAHTVLVRL
ncbi:hypothetical protein YIM_37030 [Amycolatopsis sp. YIM 10]|nr:hypothetical protein YIM_37030 [Amycolatopsis sp. YIM 10]